MLPCRAKRETVFVGVTGESHSRARERSQVWTRCRGKRISATSPLSWPRFRQSKLAATAASFYPERPRVWRERILDCQGQLTVPVPLPSWKRVRARFFHLYPLLDLKHVWTRNVADLVAAGMHAKRWQFLWPGRFLLPRQLGSSGDQAPSACHFQDRVVT